MSGTGKETNGQLAIFFHWYTGFERSQDAFCIAVCMCMSSEHQHDWTAQKSMGAFIPSSQVQMRVRQVQICSHALQVPALLSIVLSATPLPMPPLTQYAQTWATPDHPMLAHHHLPIHVTATRFVTSFTCFHPVASFWVLPSSSPCPVSMIHRVHEQAEKELCSLRFDWHAMKVALIWISTSEIFYLLF